MSSGDEDTKQLCDNVTLYLVLCASVTRTNDLP
jgi:hypothetical protein